MRDHVKRPTAIRLVLLAILTMAGNTFSIAQDEAPPPPASVERPYDDRLLRLSEVLGAVHYLRQLCDAPEGGQWRREMQALIDAEAPDPLRRSRMVAWFNRGYESFESVYRTCTPAAQSAIQRYLNEGARISRDIVARYGRQDG